MIRPKVMNVSVYGDYCLLIVFSNAEQRIFDVRPYLEFETFKELKNKELFAMLSSTGVTVTWKNGQSIDPHELYYNSTPCFI